MHPILSDINQVFLNIQSDYYQEDLRDIYQQLTEEQLKIHASRLDQAAKIFSRTQDKLRRVAPQLDVSDIIVGYKEGCRLLQASIAGIILERFNAKYIPLMIEAIENDHETGYRFLSLIENKISKDQYVRLLIIALDSHHKMNAETALGGVLELRLKEALAKVQELTSHQNSEISSYAQEVMQQLLSDE